MVSPTQLSLRYHSLSQRQQYMYIYICWLNFDGLAQGNAYKPTKEPMNIYGYGTRASATIMITLFSQHIIRSLPMWWWKCYKWDHRLESFDFCGFIQIKYYTKIPVPYHIIPHSKVHGAYMGPTWGQQDPGGPMLAPWTLLSGINGLVQERHISSALAMELSLSCTNPLIWNNNYLEVVRSW